MNALPNSHLSTKMSSREQRTFPNMFREQAATCSTKSRIGPEAQQVPSHTCAHLLLPQVMGMGRTQCWQGRLPWAAGDMEGHT